MQLVQQAIRPLQRCECKLFDDNKKDLISFSDYFEKKGEEYKAKQLRNCAEFWGQKAKELSSNTINSTTITDLGESLHVLVQEVSTTTDGIRQGFFFDAVITVTAGSEIVFALEKAGQHDAAEQLKTELKSKLVHIEEIYQHKK